MTPSFYKELRKHFIQLEEKVSSEKEDCSTIGFYTIGVLNVRTPEKEFSIDVAYSEERSKISHAAITLLKDGSYVIIFNIDLLSETLGSVTMDILGICAHEIGHFLAGHFDEDTTSKNILNYKPEDQLFLASEYHRLKTDAAYDAYMNTLLYSLLKGGCNTREYEADLIALKMVDISCLTAIHLETMNETNIFSKIEKMNRIKQLTKYVNKYEIERTGYGLELVLTKTNGEEMSFSSSSF